MNAIKRVHVIFKTHLDIGFTHMAQDVFDRYMNSFIPQALELSEKLAQEEGPVKFVWTTGSWLIKQYLQHASEPMRARMEEGIREGRIVWHGLPFTTHTEIMDERLFEYGLSLAQELDEKYGRKTIASKMTDVPGHTIAIVPMMAERGIQYLHLGVNPVSKNPSVPKLFVWRASDGSEIIVNYADAYGRPFYLDGMEDALYFAHTGDNDGPPSIEEVRALYDRLQHEYPGADIVASTMDAYAEKLQAVKHLLPVVTEEIGDSWIHGISSDPWKIARYRELLRLRDQWVSSGALDPQGEVYARFCDDLMLVPEHTWGLNESVYLVDFSSYSPPALAAARERDVIDDTKWRKFDYLRQLANPTRRFSEVERSWQEQRDYLSRAIGALPEALAREAASALERLDPSSERQATVHAEPMLIGKSYELGAFRVAFSSEGSICSLIDEAGKVWADEEHQLGSFIYETFSKESYDQYFNEYVTNLPLHHSWAEADLGKPGIEFVDPKPTHRLFKANVERIELDRKPACDVVSVELKLPDYVCEHHGAPQRLNILYTFQRNAPILDVQLDWQGKQACRLPEASWFSFSPLVDNPNLWEMDKLGRRISPLSVVKNGNRNMHGVQSGLFYAGADGAAVIETLDTPIVCPGAKRILQFDNGFAPLDGGFHFNLHNNVWGTNFVMWFEDDMKYRFRLTLKSHG
ncbi:DUF5054 domain-containing protein [Paenibacillus sp. BC26]|uniref:DUF5054 domain-containing protein n=1 Tax=Paenibacillus sp. BC26 TaxID=1881032 RepID=UPI0008F0CF07|nr:DUF5054 domain-containing protein [Paenibacillus sp. BC26]SFT04865.1 Glycosyl hydrolases family 38 N-terminal domain-containing protein [Paenibacillus sp. BC26]